MKKISKIILINFLFLFSLSCVSQTNYLTFSEYVGIKINGISIFDQPESRFFYLTEFDFLQYLIHYDSELGTWRELDSE